MKFKNLPYWLKGVVIALVISIIIFSLVSLNIYLLKPLSDLLGIIFFGSGILASLYACDYQSSKICDRLVILLIGLIQNGLIGALIGWTISKIKSKK